MENNLREVGSIWMDRVTAAVALVLTLAGMADMPIRFRLCCFGAGAICMVFVFLRMTQLSHLVRVTLSAGAVVLMAFMAFHAWQSSLPPKDVFIEWRQPAPVDYGTSLNQLQLNAVAKFDGKEVPGTYVYNPTFGSTLPPRIDTLSVEFSPANLIDFRPSKETITLFVKDGPPEESSAVHPTPAIPRPLGRPMTPKGQQATLPPVQLPEGPSANGTVAGPITAGPCSNVQVGGSGNTQTGGNCGPPLPTIITLNRTPLTPIPPFTPGNADEAQRETLRQQWIRRLGLERQNAEATVNPGMVLSFRVSDPFIEPDFSLSNCFHCVVTAIIYSKGNGNYSYSTPNTPAVLTTDTTVAVYVRAGSPDASFENATVSAYVKPKQ